jgi:hypothetical protein
MVILAFALGAIYLIGLLVLVGGIMRAPEGFEDESGFQAGSASLREENTL